MAPVPSLLACVLVAASAALVTLWCTARRRRERESVAAERIRRLQRRIDAALHDGFDRDGREEFSQVLRTASLTTDLQAERLRRQAGIDRQAPEKYRILGRLAGQGLDAEEIAAALAISRAEAAQLLRLTSVAERGR